MAKAAGTGNLSVDQLLANLQEGIDKTKAERQAILALARQ